MPTGYTANLHDGKDQTFPEFAMECARAFGALIELRDEPNAKIPDRFEPSSWHHDEMRKAQDRLAELDVMSRSYTDAQARQQYVEATKRRDEYMIKRGQMRRRYESMLRDVQAWTPPTEEHAGLKKFMVEQLESSIKFDCNWAPDEPVRLTGEQWLTTERKKALRDIEYHAKEAAEDEKRAADRTAWVRALRSSLSTAVAS